MIAPTGLLADPSVHNAAVFCAGAMLGQFLHALKKWSDGYVWIMSNPRATVGAIIGNITGMVGFISSGSLDSINSLATVACLGLFMGMSADSVLNKGAQKVWTDEERAANAK